MFVLLIFLKENHNTKKNDHTYYSYHDTLLPMVILCIYKKYSVQREAMRGKLMVSDLP